MREISPQTRAELALIGKNFKQIKWLEGLQENTSELPANLEAIAILLSILTVSINDAKIDLSFLDQSAQIAELSKEVEDLKRQIAMGNL